MRWYPGTLHYWRLHPRLLEGDQQHDDGNGDVAVDVAIEKGQDRKDESDLDPECDDFFQEATFASGGKNKAVRKAVRKFLE